jgi:hypothetical protein
VDLKRPRAPKLLESVLTLEHPIATISRLKELGRALFSFQLKNTPRHNGQTAFILEAGLFSCSTHIYGRFTEERPPAAPQPRIRVLRFGRLPADIRPTGRRRKKVRYREEQLVA